MEVPLRRVTSPSGIEQIEIQDIRLLQPDENGVFYMTIVVGALRSKVEQDNWHIEWPGLEVKGRT